MAITGASEEVQVAIGGDASGLREATDSAVEALGNVKYAAGIAGAALGTLALGGLAKATSAAADFEEQMVEVEKVTDPETAREMGDAIQDMASRMPVAQSELANITAQAGRFGIEGKENIENFTETVAQMSVATDLTTDQAGESFARLSTLMDVPIERVGDMGNVINELSNSMATSSSEITDSALRSSGTLSQMGASSEDILSLNAAMNEASESSERAGTRLRRMAQEIQDPKKVEDIASALGMNVAEFERMREENPTELFRQMAQTMGEGGEASDELRSTLSTTSQQALTALSQNMDGLSEAQEMANQQMKEGTSLQEEYNAASSTFNSQKQITINRLRNIAIQIGENVLPVASEFLAHVNDAIAAFSEWNEQSDGMAGTIALVATALGGFAVAAASVVSVLGGTSAVLGAVGGAFAVLTGPIGLAIAAIALLAGAWQVNLFGIRDTTSEVLGTIQGLIEDGLEEIQEFWDEHGEEIAETATEAFETVVGVIEPVLKTYIGLVRPILRSVQRLWETHGDELFTEVKQTFDAVVGYIETILTFVWNNVTQPTLNKIQAVWDSWGDEIMTIVSAVFGAIELIVTQAMDLILSAIRVGLALIRGDWEGAWDIIVNYVERSWDRITRFLRGDAKAAIGAALSIVIGAVKAAADYLIGTGDGTLLGDVKSVFGSIASWISGTGTEKVKGAISGLAEAVTGVFADVWNATLGGERLEIPEVSASIPDWVPEIGGRSYDIGGQGLDIPQLETGGRITEPGMFVGGERGEELVLNDRQTAEADKGGVTVGDVEDDMRRALEQTDRTDDVTRKLDAVIRAIEESLDITIEMDDTGGRYDTF
ncbi:phage tail tape measure protein [Natronorubrum halophilum]|uniref:phage tail tape measure protein n=1 Tax=Natronorubrum halophilum TaxID=1702106 RepID=UPI0010C22262|nr:phage tail tape measure protein [Natronorubrum halophilum]